MKVARKAGLHKLMFRLTMLVKLPRSEVEGSHAIALLLVLGTKTGLTSFNGDLGKRRGGNYVAQTEV